MRKIYFLQTVLLSSLFLFFSAGILFAQNEPFITVWNTGNSGSGSNNDVVVPAVGDWDYYWEEVGNPSNNYTSTSAVSGETTISFASFTDPSSIYRLKIYPNNDNSTPFNQIQFPVGVDNKLIEIEQWGDIGWASFEKAFSGCESLTSSATDIPDLSQVTNMESMFSGTPFNNGNINNWDVSNVTNMHRMFSGANSFNQDLNGWDVSNVTDMGAMFFGADEFNGAINGWDVEQVVDMNGMFKDAVKFNQDLNNWNTVSVTDMTQMFEGATEFNGNISGWDVSNVTGMMMMFSGAEKFNQDLNQWNVGEVTHMLGMFAGADQFNGNISGWDVSKVNNMGAMFGDAVKFNSDIGGWDVSQVTSMGSMFENAAEFNSNIGGWDVSQVTNMKAMFKDATAFNQNIGGWDVSQVASMESMFENAAVFNGNIGGWDVSQVTSMGSMFENAAQFNSSIGGWDVSQVTTMHNMFKNAAEFNRNIGGWDVSQLGVGQSGSDNDISFEGSGLSDENYSRILREWAQNANIGEDVIMDAYGLDYCQDIVQHRDELINLLNWTINGDNEGTCILSVNELAASSFTISPNPAQQEVTIDGLQGKETIQLIDMTGRVLKIINNKGVSSSTLQIDDLSEGIYNLVIQKDGQQIVKKVVKR